MDLGGRECAPGSRVRFREGLRERGFLPGGFGALLVSWVRFGVVG